MDDLNSAKKKDFKNKFKKQFKKHDFIKKKSRSIVARNSLKSEKSSRNDKKSSSYKKFFDNNKLTD